MPDGCCVMSSSKLVPVVLVAACLALPSIAFAQRGGGGGGHAGGGGGRGGAPYGGTAAPRGGAPAPGHPIAGAPGRPGYPGGPGHPGGGYYPSRPYYPYYPYYRRYYPYAGYPYYWPSFSFGFYYGYPSYSAHYYAYPYPYYYPSAAPYPYPASSAPEASGAVTAVAMGGIRILDAPGEAQVFADGSYAGRVDDFDQPSQQLSLTPGVHQIEIRVPGQPSKMFDVNIQAGQTINYHAK